MRSRKWRTNVGPRLAVLIGERMKKLIRPMAVLGALASLAAASNAAITFSNFTGTGAAYLSDNGSGVLKFEPSIFTSGAGNLSGSFTVSTDTVGLTDGDVKVGNSLLVGPGNLDFSATIVGVGVAYSSSAPDLGSLAANGPSVPLSAAAYIVTYNLDYSGSIVSFTSSSFTFHDAASNPVPEPASMAALGVGAVGLLARRRRNK